MIIRYNNNLTVETIGDPIMDNYKDSAAYYWTAYDPSETDDFGDYPAYYLIYIVPYDMTGPDDIDWTAPDDIQGAGSYDPVSGQFC